MVVSLVLCSNISMFKNVCVLKFFFQAGSTALILASQEERTDVTVVELLIEHNADVNARTEVRFHVRNSLKL